MFPALDIKAMNPPMNITVIRDNDGLEKLKDFFSRVKEVGYDIETNVVSDLYTRYIRTLQFGNLTEQYVIDLLPFAERFAESTGNPSVEAAVLILKSAQEGKVVHLGHGEVSLREAVLGEIIRTIKPVLDSKEWLKLTHGGQFEYEMTKLRLKIRMWNIWDTMLAERVLLCGLVPANAEGFFAMDDLLRKYAKVNIDKGLQKSFDDLGKQLTEDQFIYAALDTRLPFGIRAHQMKKLEKDGLVATAQVEFDALPAFGDMRVNGFYCNAERWLKKAAKNAAELKTIIAKMDEVFIPIVGEAIMPVHDLVRMEVEWRDCTDKTMRAVNRKAFLVARGQISEFKRACEKYEGRAAINYSSNDQLLAALRKMGYGPKALPNTNDTTLEKHKGDIVIDLIREYRTYNKAVDSYGPEFLKKYVSAITGRIHSRINQIGAMTGRTSSDSPNIQNVPQDADYRSCFMARPGYKIITVDVSGCELRIVTDMSGEPVWLEAFNNDWDVHSLGAAAVYPDKWRALADPDCTFYKCKKKCKCKGHKGKEKTQIKALNFGVIYGLSWKGYARDSGKSKTEAETDLLNFRRWIPVLWGYLEKLSDDATWKHESRTTLGRRRIFMPPTTEEATKRAINYLKKIKSPRQLPTMDEVNKEKAMMWASIGREGRNAPIQGGNADLMKLAMGCGFDENGKPFLWHTLEQEHGAWMENLVHDELVVEAPEATSQATADAIQDAIMRAGHEIYKKVKMESEANIADCWEK